MKHWSVLEADFQLTYNLDLTKIFTGELTLRRAAILIEHLPPGSLFRKYKGGPLAWTDEVSALYNAAHRLEGTMILTQGGKKNQIPPPPKPPEEDWVEKMEEEQQKREDRARAWIAEHGA